MTRRGVLTGLLLGFCWLSLSEGVADAQSRRSRTSGEHEKNHRDVRAAFGEPVAAASKATVGILADGEQIGLGTVVDPRGLILTKASLLRGRSRCRVRARRLLDATVSDSESPLSQMVT